MLAIKIIAGALIGIIGKVICNQIEKILLSRRDLQYEHSRLEEVIFYILMAAAGATIAWRTDLSIAIAYKFLLLMICELVAVIDLHHRIIPNGLILSLLIVGVAFGVPYLFGVSGFSEFDIIQSMIGLVAGFVIFAFPAVLSKSVGAGDIKLAAAVGFCLGIMNLLVAIVIMGICVLVYTLVQNKLAISAMLQSMIPMGPFIALAMIVVINIK